MQSKQTQWSMIMALALAGAFGFMAFMAGLILFELGFNGSLFVGIVVAAVVFIILLLGFHDKPAQHPGHGAKDAPGVSGGATAAASKAGAESSGGAPAAAAASPAASAPAAKKTPAAKPAPAAAPSGEDYDKDGKVEGEDEGTKPATLDGPRAGGADNLKEIKGVGPKMETMLNDMGFYHFDQIAAWTADEVAWVNANLQGFKGRVTRDNWVEQAKILAAGGETEFSKRVDKGDVY